MDNKIEELKLQIKHTEQENEIIKTQIEQLIEKFNIISGSKNLIVQEKKEKIYKNIYDLKRQYLYNKMRVFNYKERIEYISVKGKEMPENFKKVEFSNDSYHNIETDVLKQTKVKPSKKILNGLFKSEFFSMQKTIDTENKKLDDKIDKFNNYVLAIKKIFNDNISNINEFLSTISYTAITNQQLIFAIEKYIDSIQIKIDDYNLPKEYLDDLKTIKYSYKKLMISELTAYMKENMNENDLIKLSTFPFYGSKKKFMNNLNMLLNKYAECQIEKFKLETDIIRYNLKDNNRENTLNDLSYVEQIDISEVTKQRQIHM